MSVSILQKNQNFKQLPREHFFYVHLIDFLAPLFPNITPKNLNSLSDSSYKYFKFLLSFDEFIDSKNDDSEIQLSKFINLKDGFMYYEQSICSLANLFSLESDFWNSFQKCKDTYFKTILLEKQLSYSKPPIDEILFEQIAIGKSAICLNAVYAIQVLAKRYDFEQKLVELVNQIHIAFQLLDDIDDFKKDIHENQWTYPQYLLETFLAKNNIEDISEVVKHKYLYISGIVEINLQKAITHFQLAKVIASDLKLHKLKEYLEKQIGSTIFHDKEVKFLHEKTRIKALKSQTFTKNINLESCIKSSIHYLESNLENDSTWSDFMTSAGAGKAWVTGFVGLNLAEIDNKLSFLNKVTLVIQKNPHDFLSYNQSIFQDGDSTNFLVGFFHQMNLSNENINSLWQKFINPDGGWVTYRNAEELRKRLELPEEISVQAWLSPKICVSAVACYILSNLKNSQTFFDKTANFLISNIEEEHWKSYWWTSSIYATSYSILALTNSDKYKIHCQKPSQWLSKEQNQSGFWVNPINKKANAFYTSLALKALIAYDNVLYANEIRKGINWLLETQMEDGSWITDRILQIPATNLENPNEVAKWRNSSFGVNCITDDYNRVFTTSTVVNCLSNYKKTLKC